MPGTRTAPDVTTTATVVRMAVHYIDNSDDVWSESYIIPAASTAAQREAFIDSLQAGTNASIYKVTLSNDWGTDALGDSSNALDASKSSSVFDKLGITLKHGTDPEKKNKIISVPAPIKELFVNAGDVVMDEIDINSATLASLITAYTALFGAGWFTAWARYVEKAEMNEKVRL